MDAKDEDENEEEEDASTTYDKVDTVNMNDNKTTSSAQ